MVEITKEIQDKALEAIEVAKSTGKLKKGTNEVTKAIERGNAKLVVFAEDVSPKEIVMHLPVLSEEKEIICVNVSKKDDLGAAAGLSVGTSAVAIVVEGNAKDIIAEIKKQL
jgi:large subunit ribosomal protein L7Ae